MTQPLRRSGMLVSQILRGCEGKRRYPDEYVARAMAQIQQELNSLPLYFYPCKICRGWHLTKHKQANPKHAASYEFKPTPR
jgi:hypothetical protein